MFWVSLAVLSEWKSTRKAQFPSKELAKRNSYFSEESDITHIAEEGRESILYIYTDFHHLVCQRNLKTRPKIFTQKSFHLLEALSGLPT